MTRINVGYDPKKLTRQHLLAEHREIKRIPNVVKSGKAKLENISPQFTLGKGHVTFFYDKLGYLFKRYKKIYAECVRRGYQVEDYSSAWKGIKPTLMNDYAPTLDDKMIIVARINAKLHK